MKPKTIEHMQYFVGKVCTIITTQINRQFNEQIARDHYAIRVGEVTVDGIWGVHPEHDIVSYFPMTHIVSIHEEMELNMNNPEHKKIVEEYEQKYGKKPDIEFNDEGREKKKELLPVVQPKKEPPVPTYEDDAGGEEKVTFVDINAISQLAKHTKKTFDAQKVREATLP